MERSVSFMPAANGAFMQISGFSFVYSSSAPAFARVQSITLAGGAPILNDGSTYTLGTSDFTATGGDGYALFAAIPGTATRTIEADVLLNHIVAQAVLTPAMNSRITAVP